MSNMRYADTSRLGRPFAKDPAVVRFADRYLLYYSLPPFTAGGDAGRVPPAGWAIGIAQSQDLNHWEKIGEIQPAASCEANGICAPGAVVLDGRVRLFYQTYGNGPRDAICHAWSDDGVNFTRDPTNPVFRPSGAWTAGRAIDADVIAHEGRLLLYFATRDPSMTVQMLGVAGAPLESSFARGDWAQLCDGPILQPELPWERRCIEAPALCRRGDTLFMFYAGGYNNEPQQIGCASSADGTRWQRLSAKPILSNGPPGAWNASESGHPFLFTDLDGRTHLFYQGNNDGGHTWYLARREILWSRGIPYLAKL